MKKQNLEVLYEDNHLIAVNKPSGVLVQGDRTGDTPLSDLIKINWLILYDKIKNILGNIPLENISFLKSPDLKIGDTRIVSNKDAILKLVAHYLINEKTNKVFFKSFTYNKKVQSNDAKGVVISFNEILNTFLEDLNNFIILSLEKD